MSVSTILRPNATGGSSNFVANVFNTFQAILSDQSDGTWAFGDGTGPSTIALDLADFAFSGGATQVKSIQSFCRLKTARVGSISTTGWGINLDWVCLSGANQYAGYALNNAEWALQSKAGAIITRSKSGHAFTAAEVTAYSLYLTSNTSPTKTTTDIYVYEFWIEVISLVPPTVTNVAVGGPVNNQPIVTWQFNGDLVNSVEEIQTAYQVKVFTNAVVTGGGFSPDTSAVVWDSGVQASAIVSKQVGIILPNDTYVMYVRAEQNGDGQFSPWVAAGSTYVVLAGPNAPTLLSPNSGATVDTNAGFTLSWTYSHPNAVAMASYQLRRATDGGPYQYWRESDSTWQSTPQDNGGGLHTSKTFAAALWSDAHTYAWSILVTDTNNIASLWASDATILARTPPTVNVLTPSGTVTTTTRPTISWSFTDGSSRAEDVFQVRVFTLAETLVGGFAPAIDPNTFYDSGLLSGPATSIVPNVDFPPDNSQFVVYVRAQAGGQWSAWDHNQFGCLVAAPSAPVSITAVFNLATNNMDIVVTGQAEGSFHNLAVIVERLAVPGTGIWEQVRFASAVAEDGSHIARVSDKEAIPHWFMNYRAKISGLSNSTGFRITSLPTQIASLVALSTNAWWVKDVFSGLSSIIPAGDGLVLNYPVNAGTFDTAGQNQAVVVSETAVRSARGTLKVWLKGGTAAAIIMAIFQPGTTLLVQGVLPGEQWYFRVNGPVVKTFLRGADPTFQRAPIYDLSVPVVEVVKPVVV